MDQPSRQEFWNWGDAVGGTGRLLALARRFRAVSQTNLARRLKVSAANISRIEHGADPRVSTLVEFARALKFEPVLVPKEHLTAVRALLESLSAAESGEFVQRPRFG